MRSAVLRRHRSRAQRTLLVIIAALVLVISGVAAGLGAYLTAATDVGVRTALSDAAPGDVAYQVTARAGDDVSAADDAVTETLAQLLPGVPYGLHRSVVTGTRSIYRGDAGPGQDDQTTGGENSTTNEDAAGEDATGHDAAGEPAALTRGVLAAYDDLPDHAVLVDGQWPHQGRPAAGRPVAIHASSAAALGLRVGDVLSVSDRGQILVFVVTGTWRPTDADDAFWHGAPLETDGAEDRVGLFAVATDSDLAAIPGTTITSRWRLAPDIQQLTAADVAIMRAGLPRVPLRLEGDARVAGARVGVAGGLLGVLQDSDDRIQAARSVAVVPLIVIGVIGVLALGLVAQLLALARRPETSVLRARGASSSLLTWWAVREALAVGVLPAAVGGLLAWLALQPVTDVGPSGSVVAVTSGAAAAAVIAVATLTVVGARAAVPTSEPPDGSRVARARRGGVRAGTSVLVAAAAAFGLWQLDWYAGPTVADRFGVAGIDPVAVTAPAAALFAGGLAATVAVALAAWAAQRLAWRRRGLAGSLAVRQIARRPGAYALPVLLIVMATGSGTLAAGFAATWADLQRDVAARRTGADLQVVLGMVPQPGRDSAREVDLDRYRAIPGVRTATPVIAAPRATTADGAVELLVRPTAAGEPPAGVELPVGARSIEVELEASAWAHLDEVELEWLNLDRDDVEDPPPGEVVVDLWLADRDGVTALVTPEPAEITLDAEPVSYTVEADLPAGTEPWRVVAVDLQVDGGPGGFEFFWNYDYGVEVSALRTQPRGVPARLGSAGGWTRVPSDAEQRFGPHFAVSTPPAGLGLVVDSGGLRWAGPVVERLLPGDRHLHAGTAPVPVVATDAALSRFGLSVGDRASLQVFGADLPVRVADRITVAAGTTGAQVMVADTGEITRALLEAGRRPPQTSQVWLDVEPDALADGSTAAAVAALTGPGTSVLDRAAIEEGLRSNVFAGLSVMTFWVASGAAIVLATAGLAAGAAVLLRERRPEVAMLRAVGLSPAQQARTRRREQVFIVVAAVALGAATGWLVTYVTAGPLAVAATPSPVETLQPVLRVAPGPWAAYLGTAFVAGLLVALAHGRQVRRQASDGTFPPGVR